MSYSRAIEPMTTPLDRWDDGAEHDSDLAARLKIYCHLCGLPVTTDEMCFDGDASGKPAHQECKRQACKPYPRSWTQDRGVE